MSDVLTRRIAAAVEILSNRESVELGGKIAQNIADLITRLAGELEEARKDSERLDWADVHSRVSGYGPTWSIAWEFGDTGDVSIRDTLDARMNDAAREDS